ncbi:chorismate mutase [Aureibacillus halotolerans]|uniref:chorismate mutase n=1 Tax=Aureibacillus halotolerans TaxID=1508390 RepID=A0A4R6U4Z0_9BACI|nr:chorismate mutase [Aureibacillus halotolerans]TDQ41528.1 chorismate mutase [Aureibacillus halotolerans]
MIRGIRGATTVKDNNESDILDNTEALFRAMIHENAIEPDDVASVYVSVTENLDAVFPAKALRRIEGWTFVPIMCMAEASIVGSLTSCIRVMMHVNTTTSQDQIRHVYLEDAIVLRPDLALTEDNQV